MRPCLPALLLLLSSATVHADAPPTIAQRTAGLERHDGFLPYYWDASKGALLLDVARPGDEFLYGAGLSGGAGLLEASLDRGQLGALGLVRFERVGPRLLLRQLQTTHRSSVADAERTRVVTESFPSSVLASLPIVAEDGAHVLVDASDFVLRDTDIAVALRQAELGDYRQDTARSAFAFERSGAFPLNTELEVTLSFTSDKPAPAVQNVAPDGRTLSLQVHHTFLKLPEPGYVPRRLDPRIGFIASRVVDHTAPFTEPIEQYLVSRWRLEKKDPAAALSEPVRPIVYYLDRGIPEPERSAIHDAALWWNHAFEKAGFKNAFVLRDLPEGATFLDARYSGIEWINRADRAWSIGEFRADPRTGEILQGVARIDSHRRRTTSRIWRNTLPPHACTAGDSPDYGFLAPGGDGPFDSEEGLVLARLRYLSAHEVGHTLGLNHNFAATTFGWGSVLDYLGAHIEVKNGGLDFSDAYPTDIGSYDTLMIAWGYTPTEDPAALDRIVREGYARGNLFPLESDPRWAEYDWGPDPVAWLRTTQAVRAVILERFGPGQLAAGAPLYELQQRFSLAYLYHRFGIQAAQQHVGGVYQTNALAGDGQVPRASVPAARQKEALDLLMTALAPANLDIPDRIVAALVAEPSSEAATRERFPSEAGAVFSPLTAARSLASLIVNPLLDRERATRLTLSAEPGALSLAAVEKRLVAETWGASPDTAPRLAVLRRVAQRVVLDALLNLAADAAASPEVRATSLATLTRLDDALRVRKGTTPDEEAHLRLAERDLREYLAHPELRREQPAVPVPPGRPVG